MKLQKLCGYSCFAFILVLASIIGPALIWGTNEITDPDEIINIFENENYQILLLYNKITAILIAMFFVVLAIALQERMKSKAPNLMQFAVIAAVIAAIATLINNLIGMSLHEIMAQTKDVSSYNIVKGIGSGLKTATTHSWSWVILLSGIAGIKTRLLSKILSYLFQFFGIVGVIIFAIPSLETFHTALTFIVFISKIKTES